MTKYRINNMESFNIYKSMSRCSDPMQEIIKDVNIQKDKIIKKEIFRILSKHFKEFENFNFDDYTDNEIIEELKLRNLIFEIDEPTLTIKEAQENVKDLSFVYHYEITNPNIKIYKLLEG